MKLKGTELYKLINVICIVHIIFHSVGVHRWNWQEKGRLQRVVGEPSCRGPQWTLDGPQIQWRESLLLFTWRSSWQLIHGRASGRRGELTPILGEARCRDPPEQRRHLQQHVLLAWGVPGEDDGTLHHPETPTPVRPSLALPLERGGGRLWWDFVMA